MIRYRIQTLLLVAAPLLCLGYALSYGLRAGMDRADFVFVNQGEVSSLDPARATGIPEGRVLMALSEGLASLHPRTLEPVPACAESFEISPDGKTVRFHLRENLRWSNGSPLNARDFLFSWLRFLDPETASPYAYLLWDVEGAKGYTECRVAEGDRVEVRPKDGPALHGTLLSRSREAIRIRTGDESNETLSIARDRIRLLLPHGDTLGLAAPDSRTFEVRLAHVCPYFVTLTTFYPLFPVHGPTVLQVDGRGWLDPGGIVTNGPFRVKLRYLKDRIRMERNPHYWDADSVAIETVDALAVNSPITALNLYLTGVVDWINNVPPVVLPYVKERPDFTLSPNLGTNFLRFNLTHPPLDDRRVRRAIHLAVDKGDLVDYVLKGGQIPATSFVPPGIPGYGPPTCEAFDPERARALLAEAGFPGGEGFPELNLLYSADETSRDIAEVIALQLRKNLRIKIHPSAQERKGYFVSQNTLSYQICFCSWLGDYLDPSTFLDIFRSESGNNRTAWKNKAYDALLGRASGERNPEARARLLAEAESILLDEMPLAPLYFRTTANMIKPGWEGYFDNIQDVHPLKYIRRRSP